MYLGGTFFLCGVYIYIEISAYIIYLYYVLYNYNYILITNYVIIYTICNNDNDALISIYILLKSQSELGYLGIDVNKWINDECSERIFMDNLHNRLNFVHI